MTTAKVKSDSVKMQFAESRAADIKEKAELAVSFLCFLSRIQHLLDLAEYLDKSKQKLVESLTNNLPMRKLILLFMEQHRRLSIENLKSSSPTLLLNIASMLNLLQYELPNMIVDTGLKELILQAIKVLAVRWVDASSNQVEELFCLFNEILEIIRTFSLGSARIILINCPVGNSIPLMLLRALLEKDNLAIHELQVSLSRNDSKKRGITREELLAERMDEFGVRPNDLFIYIDEWLTGSNFNNLIKKLEKLALERNACLLAAGILGVSSTKEPRFISFQAEHDRICGRLGIKGSKLRITLPLLNENCRTGQIFFWSEFDRLAGYRKMQFYGSVFSSIVGIVEEIHENEVLRSAVRVRLMESDEGMSSSSEEVFAAALIDGVTFTKFFESGYKDFVAWKEEAATIELISNMGDVTDPEAAFEEIATVVTNSLKGREADKCVKLAVLWGQVAEIDARDPYYFKGHVPVITTLEDDLRVLHCSFLEVLMDRLYLRFPHLRSTSPSPQ